jgi:nicotinate dehydrogenase subunit A
MAEPTTALSFTLNGAAIERTADVQGKLLYLLRNACDAQGVRMGCGAGHCGACTVMVDGQAEQSCDLANWAVAGKDVISPEGLAAHPVGALVRQAFLAEQAAQCAYCINGIMVSLTALLSRNPAPDDATLTTCLNRHICRCGTHVRIWRAARRAIEQLAAQAA